MPSPTPTLAYRAVLFDFFGTLTRAVQRGPAHDRVALRLGCTPEAYREALDETYAPRSVGAFGDPFAALVAIAAHAGAYPSMSALHEAYRERIDALREDTRLRADAVIVLRTLRDHGVRTAVVSDCTSELPAFWPELPIAGLVDARILSIEQRRCKPHPSMYLTAAERLSVTPDECIYIGDGGSRELTGATAVGMTAVKLAASDLADHLTFRPDEWRGDEVPTLSDVLDRVLPGMPTPGLGDRRLAAA
jgi:putative hydrolase of the HAD superfamily